MLASVSRLGGDLTGTQTKLDSHEIYNERSFPAKSQSCYARQMKPEDVFCGLCLLFARPSSFCFTPDAQRLQYTT